MSGTIATSGALTASGTITLTATGTNISSPYTSNGAISEKEGTVLINSNSSLALTLAAPTSETDDGKILTFIFVTPQPSGGSTTITVANNSYGDAAGSSPVWTVITLNQFAGGGNYGWGITATLFAYQGHWYAIGSRGDVSFA